MDHRRGWSPSTRTNGFTQPRSFYMDYWTMVCHIFYFSGKHGDSCYKLNQVVSMIVDKKWTCVHKTDYTAYVSCHHCLCAVQQENNKYDRPLFILVTSLKVLGHSILLERLYALTGKHNTPSTCGVISESWKATLKSLFYHKYVVCTVKSKLKLFIITKIE